MATLAIKIDPTGAKEGARVVKREMADITREAEKAEKGTNRFGKTANDNFKKMAQGANIAEFAMGSLTKSAVALGSALGSGLAVALSVNTLFTFKDALAEVSTLVDTTTFNMDGLTASALAQGAAYGNIIGQVKSYYSIISAGAASAAQATETLDAANKLAIGGVTDIATAADGLTSVLNAYGSKVDGATAVSDALFVAMRAGKTTIGELSASLGKVAPLAAQTGVGFDELTAAISALTKGGIATAEATTGVRAILAAIAKPTKEASDLAKALGIQFNSAGLQAKGLAGFMQDLVKRTGGSTDALAQLFGGVEALVPAMALSGQAGVDFAAILEQMGQKAGATEDAFNKMANSPGFQAGRVWAALQAEVLGTAGAMSGPLTAALKAIADNMSTIVTVATIFTAGHLAAAILPVIANIVAMSSAMGAATVAARALSVAMAFIGGPVGLAVTALAGAYLLLRDNVSAVETATRQSESAYQSNIGLLNDAKASSEGYTASLRNQLAMQVEVAKANSILANQKFDDASNRRMTFRKITGFDFDPLTYAVEQADKSALAADIAYGNLVDQLAQVDANMKTVTTSANSAGAAMKAAANDNIDPWKGYREVTKDVSEQFTFMEGAAKGFLSTFRQSLESGKGVVQSFGDAAMSVLDKIINKLEDQVATAFAEAFSGASGSSGGGGGILGGLLGGIGKIFGFANGTNYAPGGIAMVGERGPELVELPRGARVNTASDTRRMMAPANQSASSGGRITVEVVSRVDEDGNIKPFVQRVSGEVAGQAVALAAPGIIERSQTASGQALGRGDYDSGMANYGISRQARSR